jgi:hypothetical protein
MNREDGNWALGANRSTRQANVAPIVNQTASGRVCVMPTLGGSNVGAPKSSAM